MLFLLLLLLYCDKNLKLLVGYGQILPVLRLQNQQIDAYWHSQIMNISEKASVDIAVFLKHHISIFYKKPFTPLSNRAKQLRDRTNLSFSGNTGVRAKSSYAKLWRHIGSRRVRVMKKLDESKVKWIILQKRKGETTSSIAKTMNISTRWIKKLWARYRYADPGRITYPAPMERPEDSIPGRREHSAMLTVRTEDHLGAVRLHGIIMDSTGINTPYNKIHQSIQRRAGGANGCALSAPIRTPCDTQTTSYSMAAGDSCAVRTTHHVLSQGTVCLSTPLPKTHWPCLRRP